MEGSLNFATRFFTLLKGPIRVALGVCSDNDVVKESGDDDPNDDKDPGLLGEVGREKAEGVLVGDTDRDVKAEVIVDRVGD